MSSHVTEALGWTLIHFLWQGTLIALFLAAANFVLRRSSAHLRYIVACAAMLLMLIVPAGTFVRMMGNASGASSHHLTQTAGILNLGRAMFSDRVPPVHK